MYTVIEDLIQNGNSLEGGAPPFTAFVKLHVFHVILLFFMLFYSHLVCLQSISVMFRFHFFSIFSIFPCLQYFNNICKIWKKNCMVNAFLISWLISQAASLDFSLISVYLSSISCTVTYVNTTELFCPYISNLHLTSISNADSQCSDWLLFFRTVNSHPTVSEQPSHQVSTQ